MNSYTSGTTPTCGMRYGRVALAAVSLAMLAAQLWSINPAAAQANSAYALGVPQSEVDALTALYNATGGPGWTDNTNWLTGSTPWYGVTVSAGHVTSVNLTSNNLTGLIPAALGSLTSVQWLSLDSNQLQGSIPAELGNLASLQWLYLGGNQLTGSIPTQLGNLTNLLDLEASSNQLSGSIPAELGNLASLQNLYLHSNQLSGSIPAELGGLAGLQRLYLGSNQLTGSIPAQLGSLANLQDLYLGSNQLSGSIPSALGSLSNLQWLSLGYNYLSGSIPAELGNLTSLVSLDLFWNELSGSIPAELGSLSSLQTMDMAGNQLTGYMPAELGNLAGLTGLYLDHNQLTGAIPAEFGNLASLQGLDLSANQLTGLIPAELGGLASLLRLRLSNNQLSGSIPAALGSLASLELLDVSSNQLMGEMPPSIVNLANLGSNWGGLELSYNGLWSTDPDVILFLSQKNPGWQNYQTIAPADVSAAILATGGVVVSWTPIPYQSDPGYYEVGVSAVPGGPYTFDPANRTPDKAQSSITLVGEGAGGTLYVVVRAVTLADWYNQSTLTSPPSSEAVAVPAPSDKRGADGLGVGRWTMILSATLPDCYYFQAADRSWGIKVIGSASLTGNRADISGTLHTGANGERYIQASSITDAAIPPAPGEPIQAVPLGLQNKALGGADWFWNPATGAGQRGITGGSGLNNIGLLVRIWGQVTCVGEGYFYVDDGSRVSDGTGAIGIYCAAPTGVTLPAFGSYVSVTGASSCEFYAGNLVNVLRVRDQADITTLAPPPAGVAPTTIPSDSIRPRGRLRTQ